MVVLVRILVSSCLLLVYGDASTNVTDVNVTTALPRTNWTDSLKDSLNNTTPSRIVQDPTPNENKLPTTVMSLTAPIFMTPTPSPTGTSPTTTNTSNSSEGDAYPTFYTSSPTVSWTSTPSTPSEAPKDPTAFNPYPGYFLPTNSTTTRPPPITLFPTSQNQSQNHTQNQNQSRPLPTTTYIEMTPPPTPTPSIMSPSVISPDTIENSTPQDSESFTMSIHDKSYFRVLFAIYLVVIALLVIYIMKD